MRMTVSNIALAISERMRSHPLLPNCAARRAMRAAAGLTTADLAEIVGVSRQTICNWEAGRRTPRGEDLRRYREALDAMRASLMPASTDVLAVGQ
jgi:transcriptional regulator with XRE-family HTH domain